MMEMGFEIIREHAFDIVSGLGLLVCGWLCGRWRTTRQWASQEFFGRLHISLTLVGDGRLSIRTLGERSCIDVFGNSEAARAIADAARRTSPADPLLDLPREGYWSFLNSLVNELSSVCAQGFIADDLGVAVRRGSYIVCLTCERDADVRTRKVRAIVVRKEVLLTLPESMPRLDREQDVVRWKTLQLLAADFPQRPWRYVEVELVS